LVLCVDLGLSRCKIGLVDWTAGSISGRPAVASAPFFESSGFSSFCRHLRIVIGSDRPRGPEGLALAVPFAIDHGSKEAFSLLEQLYDYQRLYQNFFEPVRKLVSRERVGARVVKRYDCPATPYQGLLATGRFDAATARKLDRLYRALNPAKPRQ